MTVRTLGRAAVEVLSEPSPAGKVEKTRDAAADWRAGAISDVGTAPPPDRPARPEKPELLPPGRMPRRSTGGGAGRVAFLHAIAHIEFNAIDLAWDIVARFTDQDMPRAFYDDWVGVALDEAEHFDLLARRLAGLGAAYGDLPAHDGLWEAAERTADDLAARLALVPMVLEARGLDTAPKAAARFRDKGDAETAEILARIAAEEEPHVAAGVRWFEYLCDRRGVDPVPAFHDLVETRFKGSLKPPFDHQARARAGMKRAYYEPLAAGLSPSGPIE